MSDLILIIFENRDTVRCTDLDDAKSKALAGKGKVIVEATSESGGPIATLEFDREAQDWIPA